MKEFSVLIVVKSGKYIEKLIDSITDLNCNKEKAEFILLDNNCDKSVSKMLNRLIKEKPYFKIFRVNHDLNIPEARNYLLKYTNGKFIVFTDHDVILEPEWLKKFRKRFEEGYDMIGGRMDSIQKEILPRIENIRKNIWYDYVDRKKISHFENANVAFRREVISNLKFDNKAKFAEDLDFTTKVKEAGFKLKFDKDIYVFHNHRTKLKDYLKTFFKYGVSHAYVDKKDNVVGLRKKFKIFLYALFPLILFIFYLFVEIWSILLLLIFLINKYTIPAIRKGFVDKNPCAFLVLFLEPLRFLTWSYGFIIGMIKNE